MPGSVALDSVDPYAGSTAVETLRERMEMGETLRLACLDIDSTLTGEFALANEVRAGLQGLGFVVGFVTSRTEEMVMSRSSFVRSRDMGLDRPAPKLREERGRHVYVPPEEQVPQGLLDGDVIAGSSGTRIFMRQKDGGYLPDLAYEARFGSNPQEWRAQAVTLLEWTQARGCRADQAPIEDPDLYDAGRADVFPPQYRMQINFPSLDDKLCFVTAVAMAQRENTHGARAFRITDDSNPVKERYKLFLTPRRASKAHAVETIVAGLCCDVRMERQTLCMFFAGDSFPDLKMGLLGGLGTAATLLLAGGSRLVPHLVSSAEPTFAGEPLRAFRRRLAPEGPAGYYRFRMPRPRLGTRRLVVGDEAFPGTIAVQTVAAYVRELAAQAG